MSNINPSPSRTLVKLGITIVGFVLLLILFEGGFNAKIEPGQTEVQNKTSTSAASETTAVVRLQGTDQSEWPATITAPRLITIAPALQGRILELPVKSGQRVERGQLLARIDHQGPDARAAQARSELKAREAEAERARADAHRLRALYDREAATRQALESAEALASQGEAMVAKARESVRETEAQQAETRLLAPFDGLIKVRHQEPGDMAMPGQPVLTLLQSGALRVESSVPSRCHQGLKIGTPLSIKAGPSQPKLTAAIDEMEPSEDVTTHTLLIKATLPSSETRAIRPGAFATITLPCGTLNALAIPKEAIHRNGQLEMVRILKDGQPTIRLVRTGRDMGSLIEILSGLEDSDRIVMDQINP